MSSVSFRPQDVPVGSLYDLMSASIAPRPIGFISTLNAEGRGNLAPFSYFIIGGVNPASLCFCPANRSNGEDKDSLRNTEATGEFVANILVRTMAEGMNQTGVDYPGEVDEWPLSGFTAAPSVVVAPPRVLESPVAFECKLHQVVRHGSGPHGTNYVIGEVVYVHVEESLWNDGKIVAAAFRPLGRMGGQEYIDLGGPEIFELARPKR